MRSLSTSQAQFQSQVQVDQDIDGTGEYGLLNELSGATKVRSSGSEQKIVNPNFIPSVLAVTNNKGYGSKSGYHFQIFLPHINKVVTDNNGVQKSATDANSIDAQEKQFIAYAWPGSESSGRRCAVVDQAGEVRTASNVDSNGKLIYHGAIKMPGYNAALKIDEKANTLKWGNLEQSDRKAQDSQIWTPAGG